MSQFANALFTRLNVGQALGQGPLPEGRASRSSATIPRPTTPARSTTITRTWSPRSSSRRVVDGSDVVGHEKPFGVFVNLRHTTEIERESGGFGRYLQNQNNSGYYYYNFGRPLENYRDKFQEIVKQALQEQFEVISVTFQDEKVNSRATSEYGWRVTPYAYLLLKARGPKVDKIAPLRLDLDFMDTSGYVILPVESPPIPDRRHAGKRGRPASREAPDHPEPGRAAGQGRQADPRGQGHRPRPGSRSRDDPRCPVARLRAREDRRSGALRVQVRSRQRGERGRLGANLAGALPGRSDRERGAQDLQVRQGQGRRRRDDLPALCRCRPGQGRARGRSRGALRRADLRLALVAGRRAAAGCAWRSARSSRLSAPAPGE